MNKKIYILSIILIFSSPFLKASAQNKSPNNKIKCIVKVFSFHQSFNYYYPWEKNKFYKRTSYGTLIKGGYILTTADTITDYTYVELKKPSSEKKYKAKVIYKDYNSNIALLKAEDSTFYEDLSTIELAGPLKKNTTVYVLKIKNSNDIKKIKGQIEKVFIEESFLSWNEFLTYRISVKFENRGAWAEPVIYKGKLAGILTNYNSDKFTAYAIPSELIRHFINDIQDKNYNGFPNPGLIWEGINNPYLKDYLGMKSNETGIYVSEALKNSTSENILKKGDVITNIDGHDIDDNGYFKHPIYGKILFSYLYSSKFPGESIKLKVIRNKKLINLECKLKVFGSEDYFIPLYSYDKQAKYIIEGGMLFQEVTVKYLKSWGENWENTGNIKLLYYYNYYAFNSPDDRKRLVVLSYVLPDDINIGYQDFKTKIVTKVNNIRIKSLDDLARAFDNPKEKYIKITFDDGKIAIFEKKALSDANTRISNRFGIKNLRKL